MATVKSCSVSGALCSSSTTNAKRIDARPLGPNQPAKMRVSNEVPEPISDNIVGMMRTTVSDKTA